MIFGANLILVVLLVMFLVGLIAMAMKDSLVDFVKANFGLMVLLLLFLTLLGVTFHVFHESSDPMAKDFLTWLEGKAGEVLAAVMTLIVGVRAANARAGDKTDGSSTSTTTTTSSSTSNATAVPTTGSVTGAPH